MLEIAICDDDKKDMNSIVDMLENIFIEKEIDYNLQSFNSAVKMLEELKQIDIAILDISMEELNGIDLGRKIKTNFPEVKLVYITFYEHYCMQAINEVHAFSFLCKPIEKDKLQKQILNLVGEIRTSEDIKEKIFYKVCDDEEQELQAVKLRLKDIIYFEYIKSNRKIAIILKDRVYKCPYVMEKLVEELKDEGFVINCRGQLVNLRHIAKIKGYQIHLKNGHVLYLSQKRVSEFKKSMNDFLHNNNF